MPFGSALGTCLNSVTSPALRIALRAARSFRPWRSGTVTEAGAAGFGFGSAVGFGVGGVVGFGLGGVVAPPAPSETFSRTVELAGRALPAGRRLRDDLPCRVWLLGTRTTFT